MLQLPHLEIQELDKTTWIGKQNTLIDCSFVAITNLDSSTKYVQPDELTFLQMHALLDNDILHVPAKLLRMNVNASIIQCTCLKSVLLNKLMAKPRNLKDDEQKSFMSQQSDQYVYPYPWAEIEFSVAHKAFDST